MQSAPEAVLLETCPFTLSLCQLVQEGLWQADVRNPLRLREQRCNLPVPESRYAATDRGVRRFAGSALRGAVLLQLLRLKFHLIGSVVVSVEERLCQVTAKPDDGDILFAQIRAPFFSQFVGDAEELAIA